MWVGRKVGWEGEAAEGDVELDPTRPWWDQLTDDVHLSKGVTRLIDTLKSHFGRGEQWQQKNIWDLGQYQEDWWETISGIQVKDWVGWDLIWREYCRVLWWTDCERGTRLGVALWRWPLFPNHFFEAKWSESWCSSGKAHYVVQIKPWTWRWGKRKNNEYRGTGRICNVPEVPGCLDAKNRLTFSWVIRENVFCLCLSAFSWRVSMLLQWQNTKRKINVH